MPRGTELYLQDILESIRRIERYTSTVSEEGFYEQTLIQDGVVRNLEIIGEAVKKLPLETRAAQPQIDWKKVASLRDILIHQYACVDLGIVWDIVTHQLPPLKATVQAMLRA